MVTDESEGADTPMAMQKKETDNLDVTVVMPSYNRSKKIVTALESIYRQTRWPSRVIVVDDHSSDNTVEVVSQWAKEKQFPVLIEKLPENSGPAAARNRGIELGETRYIAFLDSDDEYQPECLERLVEPFGFFPEAVLSFSEASIVTPKEKVTHGIVRPNIDMKKESEIVQKGTRIYHKLHSPIDSILRASIIPTCSVCFCRDTALKVGGMPSSFRSGEDWLFWLRMVQEGEVYFQSEPLSVIHRHDDNLTHARRAAFVAHEKLRGFAALLNGDIDVALNEARRAKLQYFYTKKKKGWYYHLSCLGVGAYIDGIRKSRQSKVIDESIAFQIIKQPKSLLRSILASTNLLKKSI